MRWRLGIWALIGTCGCGFSFGTTTDASPTTQDGSDAADPDAIEIDAPMVLPDALPSNLVAWYPMDELVSGQGTDATGHGHTAVCTGATCPIVMTAKIGNGYSFDGNDDRMDVASTVMLTTTTAFTVAFWVQFSSFPNTYACPVGKYFGSGMANSWQLCNTQDNGGRWFYGADSDAGFSLTYNMGPQVGVWYHAAITWDNTSDTKRIWINGTSQATQTGVGTIHFDGGPVTLGADLTTGNAQADRFAGLIDDVRIYNTALSGTEIMALAAGP